MNMDMMMRSRPCQLRPAADHSPGCPAAAASPKPLWRVPNESMGHVALLQLGNGLSLLARGLAMSNVRKFARLHMCSSAPRYLVCLVRPGAAVCRLSRSFQLSSLRLAPWGGVGLAWLEHICSFGLAPTTILLLRVLQRMCPHVERSVKHMGARSCTCARILATNHGWVLKRFRWPPL